MKRKAKKAIKVKGLTFDTTELLLLVFVVVSLLGFFAWQMGIL